MHEVVRAGPLEETARGWGILVDIRKFVRKHDVLLYLFCIFICSYYLSPNERIFKSIFYYLVFPSFLFSITREHVEIIKGSMIFRLSMVWVGYLCVTLIWSDEVALRDLEKYIRGFLWIGVFFSVVIILSQKEGVFPKYLFLSVASVATVTAIFSAYQYYSVHEIIGGRLIGIGPSGKHAIATAIFYGAAMLMTALGLSKLTHSPATRIAYGLAVSVLLLALLLTLSRGPILGAGLAMVFGLVATRRWALLATLAVAGAAIVGLVAFSSMFAGVDIGKLDFIGRGSSYRLEIWSNVLDRIQEAFWFGHGIASDMPKAVMSDGSIYITAHQMYLANHYVGGVPATILLVAVIVVAFQVAIRRARTGGEVVYAALLIFFLVFSATYIDKVVKSANVIWFYVWLPLALLAGQEALMKRQASENVPPESADG